MPEVGFEPTHPKITELKSAALDHSAIQASINNKPTAEGFEPVTSRLEDYRLNHSAMLSYPMRGNQEIKLPPPGIEPGTF